MQTAKDEQGTSKGRADKGEGLNYTMTAVRIVGRFVHGWTAGLIMYLMKEKKDPALYFR